MTDAVIPSQQSWKRVHSGSALAGSGIFGFTDSQKAKGGGHAKGAHGTGAIGSTRSFDDLFTNSLEKAPLAAADPHPDDVAADNDGQPGSPRQEAATDVATDAQPSALSAPLSPSLVSFLMGLTEAGTPASTPEAGTAAAETSASPSPAEEEIPSLDSLLTGLDASSSSGGLMPWSDEAAPAGDGAVDEDKQTADLANLPANSAQLPAAALQEMQKALAAYMAAPTTMAAATLAA